MTDAGPALGEDWEIGGRIYSASVFRQGEAWGYELADVSPDDDPQSIMSSRWDSTSQEFTFTAETTDPVPFELVKLFVELTASNIPSKIGAADE